jgi:hypothetical protein
LTVNQAVSADTNLLLISGGMAEPKEMPRRTTPGHKKAFGRSDFTRVVLFEPGNDYTAGNVPNPVTGLDTLNELLYRGLAKGRSF